MDWILEDGQFKILELVGVVVFNPYEEKYAEEI